MGHRQLSGGRYQSRRIQNFSFYRPCFRPNSARKARRSFIDESPTAAIASFISDKSAPPPPGVHPSSSSFAVFCFKPTSLCCFVCHLE